MAFLVISVEVSCFPFKFQFTPQHLCSYSPHYSLYFPYGTDEENLFDNQKLLKLLIISFILMTFAFD